VQRAKRPGGAAERDQPGKYPRDNPQSAPNHFRSPCARLVASTVIEELRRIRSIGVS
jgi:hypothetical protein